MAKVSDMLGLTLKSVVHKNDGHGQDRIVFTVNDAFSYQLWHSPDCCELVCIEDIVGSLDDLVDSPLTLTEETSQTDPNATESGTWTFYRFATVKGYVTIRWYGSSNGYYSESVDFAIVKES